MGFSVVSAAIFAASVISTVQANVDPRRCDVNIVDRIIEGAEILESVQEPDEWWCTKRCMMNDECAGLNYEWISSPSLDGNPKNGHCHLLKFDGDETFVPSPDTRWRSRILCDPECDENIQDAMISVSGTGILDSFMVGSFQECEDACNAQSATCNALQVSELGLSLRCFLLELEAGLFDIYTVPNYNSKRFCDRIEALPEAYPEW